MAAIQQALATLVLIPILVFIPIPIILINDLPQPRTLLSTWNAAGEMGVQAGAPLHTELRLSLEVVKNKHLIGTISHLQSPPTDGLIFLTGLKSSTIWALLTPLPDQHFLDLPPCSFLSLGFWLLPFILP